jgi:hypothetical protein
MIARVPNTSIIMMRTPPGQLKICQDAIEYSMNIQYQMNISFDIQNDVRASQGTFLEYQTNIQSLDIEYSLNIQ